MAAADYASKVPARVQTENSEKVQQAVRLVVGDNQRLFCFIIMLAQAATLEEELTTIARAAELFKSLRE